MDYLMLYFSLLLIMHSSEALQHENNIQILNLAT